MKGALALCLVISAMSVSLCSAEANPEHVVGIVNEDGVFAPKARIAKHESFITFTKVNPQEKLGTIEIRFIAEKVVKGFSMREMFIQWENRYGPGRLWRLESQKSFDPRRKAYRSAWNTSPSFRILDKSRRRLFKKCDWDEVVSVTVNGKPLIVQEPVPKPPAVRILVEPTPDHLFGTERVKAQGISQGSPIIPEVHRRAPSHAASVVGDSRGDMGDRYAQLARRMVALEDSIETLRNWLIFIPIVILAILGLIAVTVRLRHVTKSRRPSHRTTLATLREARLGPASNSRLRQAG